SFPTRRSSDLPRNSPSIWFNSARTGAVTLDRGPAWPSTLARNDPGLLGRSGPGGHIRSPGWFSILVAEDRVAWANRHFANGRRTEARQGRAEPAAARRERSERPGRSRVRRPSGARRRPQRTASSMGGSGTRRPACVVTVCRQANAPGAWATGALAEKDKLQVVLSPPPSPSRRDGPSILTVWH